MVKKSFKIKKALKGVFVVRIKSHKNNEEEKKIKMKKKKKAKNFFHSFFVVEPIELRSKHYFFLV
jgi:hypothetical protein